MGREAIKIAGAGPSGLTAAINLAKAGIPVDVFEKRSDTGKRFHGDLQGLENWSSEVDVLDLLRDMNLRVNFDCAPILKQITTNGVKSRISIYDQPLCYLVKRGDIPGSLDQGLKDQALDSGVNIHFSKTIALEKADIIATGPISKELFAVDKGIVFSTTHDDLNVFLINDKAAYKGYSYLLITKGYGCMCTVLFDRFKELDECFEVSKCMLTEMFPVEIENPSPVAGVGCFSTRNIFQKGSRMFVGEAAGIQDLLLGFGIKTAIESGHLAAECIIQGHDYREVAKSQYEGRLKATLVNRFLWEVFRYNNYAVVVDERIQSRTKRSLNLSSLYRFGSIHRAVYPLARWHMKRRYPDLRL
jgi:hypothetical protein